MSAPDETDREPASSVLVTPEYGACPECGYLMLPVLEYLPCGHDGPPALAPLDAAGTVYSWTRSWPDPTDARVIAMADFLDGALRITAPVVDSTEVAIGDTVTAIEGVDTPVALRRMG